MNKPARRRPQQPSLPFPGIDPAPSRAEWHALMAQWDAQCVRAGVECQRGTISEDEMWSRIRFYAHLWTRASNALAEMAGIA